MTENRKPETICAQLAEKWQDSAKRIKVHDTYIAILKDEVIALKEANKKQDERLERIEKNTATLVEIFKAGGGTLKTIKWLGKLLIWAGSISSAIYALWYAIVNWPQKGA